MVSIIVIGLLLFAMLFGEIPLGDVSLGVLSCFFLFLIGIRSVRGENLFIVLLSLLSFSLVMLFNKDFSIVNISGWLSYTSPFFFYMLIRSRFIDASLLQVIKMFFKAYFSIVFSIILVSLFITGEWDSLRHISEYRLVHYSFLFSPNIVGMHLVVLYILARYLEKVCKTRFYFICKLVIPIFILMTLSRSAILAFLVCIIPSLLNFKFRAVVLIVIIYVMIVPFQIDGGVVEDRINKVQKIYEGLRNGEAEQIKNSHRVRVMVSVIELISQNWVYGVGFKNINKAMYEVDAINNSTGNTLKVHGLFFIILVSGGGLSLVVFLISVFVISRSVAAQAMIGAIKSLKQEFYFSVLGLMVVMFFNTAMFSVVLGLSCIFLVYSTALQLSYNPSKRRNGRYVLALSRYRYR